MKWRLLVIVFAYLVASIVVGTIIQVIWALETLSYSGRFRSAGLSEAVATLIMSLPTGLLVALYAAIPACIVIILPERRGIESGWFYALAGVVVGLLSMAPFLAGTEWRNLAAGLLVTAFLAALGVAGGLTYWAVAGRNAGL